MHRRAALLLFGLGTAAFAQSQIAIVSFVSEPGDWIGQGQTRTLIYEPGMPGSAFQLTVVKTMPSGLPSLAYFLLGGPFSGGNTNTNVSFWIGTDMLGHELAPGFYPDFRRAVFSPVGHPGLDFSFQNRGGNETFGDYTINSVHFKPDGDGGQTLDDLDVNFVQRADGWPYRCFGHFYYSSSVPEPASLSVVMLMAGGLVARRRRSKLLPDDV